MDYINDNDTIDIEANETIAFSIEGDAFNTFYAFTPEHMDFVDGELYGLSLVTFKEGLPYFHNLSAVDDYNVFYGENTNQYVNVVCNESPQTTKKFQAIAVDSKTKQSPIEGIKYSVSEVRTSDNLVSYVPLAAFKFKENWYYSVFYRATNFDATIQTGQYLRGTWCEVKLTRDEDPDVQTEYNELAKICVFFTTSDYAIN